MVMPPGAGSAMIRVAAVIPVVLIVLFTGLLWLLGLMCGRDRRRYVTDLSQQAMGAISVLLHGSAAVPPLPEPRNRTRQR
jgi:putative Mn2+ efflux pump MntP